MFKALIETTDPKRGIYYEITPIRRVYLDLIAFCEGTDKTLDRQPTGYDILYGGGKFADLSRHPNQRIKAGGIVSSAAGRYQIMDFTENWILGNLTFPPYRISFSPEAQDQRALYLIHVKRNALRYVDSDKFDMFCKICSYEWASIPPSRYGQGYLTPAQVAAAYRKLKTVWGCP